MLTQMNDDEVAEFHEKLMLRGEQEWEEFTESDEFEISEELEDCVTSCLADDGRGRSIFDSVKFWKNRDYSANRIANNGKGAPLLCFECMKFLPKKKLMQFNFNEWLTSRNLTVH